MSFLTEEDLKQIEQTLYAPKERELKLRQIVRVNTNFNKATRTLEYRAYSRKGSAKIFAYGASARDIPFVDEDSTAYSKKVYDIATGIQYNFSELEASQARLGIGPYIPLDMVRVETARRYIAEMENKIGFVGDTKIGLKGLLNHDGINVADVAQGATGADAAAKRLWANKTPKEILADIRTARTTARAEGIFNPDTLVLPPAQYDMLDQPYSDTSTMTVRQWLASVGAGFNRVFEAKELSSSYSGYSLNVMLVMDSNPEVIELAVTREMEMFPPIYDILKNSQQAVLESTAGVIVRHPSAIYVGKGI
jgi:hypothetical protein